MRRAAVSVASNIAEAAGRSSDPDAARLLSIAAGSASELEYQLELAMQLGYSDVDAKQALASVSRGEANASKPDSIMDTQVSLAPL